MKCYDTLGGPPGLRLKQDDRLGLVIRVGERGRGRYEEVVRIHGDVDPERRELRHAKLLRSSRRPGAYRIEAVSEAKDRSADVALVYLRDRSGFRGGWSLHAGDRAGDEKITMLPEARGREAWERRRAAPLPTYQDGRITVLASGYCAQGAAGRAGGGPEFLLLLRPGAVLTVHRRGRLYGADPETTWRWTGEEIVEVLPYEEGDDGTENYYEEGP